ncbi:MAG: hypothetical protein H0U74_22390 [Bradymonadaceae bacterium]|nr:hypothetical protein [Lujinxingiaceae bacterium]
MRIARFVVSLTLMLVLSLPAFASDGVEDPPMPIPVVESAQGGWWSVPYRRSDVLLFTTIGFGAMHHVDHVLRSNHSGFPFKAQVTPFTGSLLVYPALLIPYFLDAGPNVSLIVTSLIYAGTQFAHIVLEPPSDLYGTWQNPEVNLLETTSPTLGRISQVVSIGLSIAMLGHIASTIFDGLEHGFTWSRVSAPDASPGVTLIPTFGEVTGLSASYAWD